MSTTYTQNSMIQLQKRYNTKGTQNSENINFL